MMTSNDFNEWSAHLHEHEAHRPTRPIEMACAEPDPDDKPRFVKVGPLRFENNPLGGHVALIVIAMWAVAASVAVVVQLGVPGLGVMGR